MPDPNRVELNRDLLLQRIQEIRGALASLRVEAARPRDEFVADGQAVDATKYRLQEDLGDLEAYMAVVGSLLDEARP